MSADPAAAPDARLLEASRLFEQGRDEEFSRLLEPLLAETETHLEALFLSGMLHARAGEHREAADAFRRMLVLDPRLIRPHLELALALQNAVDLDAARYHYEQVLAAGLPPLVLRNIYRQLTEIRERLPSLRLTLELGGHARIRGVERQCHGSVVQGTGFVRVTPKLVVTSTLSTKTLDYADLPYLIGRHCRIHPNTPANPKFCRPKRNCEGSGGADENLDS